MKVATVLALVGLVAAQDFSGVPSCAVPCLSKAIQAAGCDLKDTACACTSDAQAKIASAGVSCLTGECTPDEVTQAEKAGFALCAKLASGTSSAASATATGSSTASDASSAPTSGSSITSASGSSATGDATASDSSSDSSATDSASDDSSAAETPAPTAAASAGLTTPTASGNSTLSFSKPTISKTALVEATGSAKPSGSQTTTSHNAAATPFVGMLAAVLAMAAAL